MPRKTSLVIELTDEERRELESWQRSTTIRAGLARRGRVILFRAADVPILGIARQTGMRRQHIEKWVKRFRARRIDGLSDLPGRGRKPSFSPGGGRPSDQAGLRATGPRGAVAVAVGLP